MAYVSLSRRAARGWPTVLLVAVFAVGCGGSGDTPGGDLGPGRDGRPDGSLPDGAADGTVPDAEPPTEVVSCGGEVPQAPAEGTCSAQKGAGTGTLLRGTVLAPDKIYENGQLLVVAQQIVCVGCDCSDHPQFADAARIDCPNGVISPALINLHDHLGWAEGTPALGPERYDDRAQWRLGQEGKPEIPRPANKGEGDSGVWWGELRQLLAGTASIAGSATAPGLLRNVDYNDTEGLSGKASTPTFPLGNSSGYEPVDKCDYKTMPKPDTIKGYTAWIPHVAEGINASSHNEVACLDGQRSDGVDVTFDNVTFIHAVALSAQDALEMAASGTGVNWSARSNISLYGMTADVVMLRNVGVPLTLGTDWPYSGSINLLRELACANYLNETHYDNTFAARDLWRMVTATAGDASGFGDRIGRLKEGYVPDIAVFDGSQRRHFEAVTRASVADVALVMRGGLLLHGDAAVISALGDPSCEALDVCSRKTKLCLKQQIGLTLAELKTKFPAPPYPLFFCGTPDNEPTCVPTRPGEYTGQPAADDADGDGVKDGADSCPKIFNPPRPMNDGKQPDADGDKVGDECDPCPLDADTTQCTGKIDPNDTDNDGQSNDVDNCPSKANPGQEDADGDGIGDACDPCPQAKGTCPFTVEELRNPALGKRPPEGTVVRVENLVVTAIRTKSSLGFNARQGTAPFQAIFVYTKTAPTATGGALLKVGDKVTVEGESTIFNDTAQLEAPTSITVTGTGDVTPVNLKTKDLQPGSATAEQHESQLVRVSNVKVAAMVDAATTDDFLVADDGSTCSGTTPACTVVGGFHYDGNTKDGQPAVTVGQSFSAVVGVINGFKNAHTLDVRSDADLVP